MAATTSIMVFCFTKKSSKLLRDYQRRAWNELAYCVLWGLRTLPVYIPTSGSGPSDVKLFDTEYPPVCKI